MGISHSGFMWHPGLEPRFAVPCISPGAMIAWHESISCVVPCRNNLRQLADLLPRLADHLRRKGNPWEILIVDSGSDDGTERTLRHWSRFPGFRVAVTERRMSRAATVMVGISECKGRALLIVEPAGTQPLHLLEEALCQWQQGAACVQAVPIGPAREVALDVFKRPLDLWDLALLNGRDFSEQSAGFVLVDRKLAAEMMAASD